MKRNGAEILAIVLLLVISSETSAHDKFDLTPCRKVNIDLVNAVDEIIEESFALIYRTTNMIYAFENLRDCRLLDFSDELLKRNMNKFNVYRLLNHTSIPKISSRLRVINIILIDSLKSFNVFYTKVIPGVFDFRGYYLFVVLGRNFEIMQEIFEKMWRKQIFNVNAIYEVSGAINMSTFRPFTSDSCYDTSPVLIDQYTNGSFLNSNDSLHFYPKKFENLWKCEVRVVTLERCPAVCIENESKNLYGHDWDLITELERMLNFTIKLTFLRDSDKLEKTAALTGVDTVLKSQADILIGNFFLRPSYVDLMDMSVTYDTVPIVFAIPPGERLSPFEKLLRPFETTVWIFLICTLSIGLLVIFVIEYKIRSVRNFVYGTKVQAPVLNMIIAIFGSQQPVLPRRNFARFILMMFLIFCLVQRNIYQGALYIFLQSDGRHKAMQSIDEMIENDFVFYIHPRFVDLVLVHKEILERIKPVSNDTELPFSKEVDDTLHAAYFTPIDDVIYRNQKTHDTYVLQICEEQFSLLDIVMYYPRNFFLQEAINGKVRMLISSGLVHHWIEGYLDDSYAFIKITNERKQLTMNHLFGVFNILLIGYAVACISLIIEITIAKAKEYGRAKKSIQSGGRKRAR